MAVTRLLVAPGRVLVPVVFRRKSAAQAQITGPLIDDRGFAKHGAAQSDRGAVLGMPVGDFSRPTPKRQAVTVTVERRHVGLAEPLGVRVGAGLRLITPNTGILPGTRKMDVTVEPTDAPDKSNAVDPQRVSKIEILASNAKGAVISTLHVNLYAPLLLRVHPYDLRVTRNGTGGAQAKGCASPLFGKVRAAVDAMLHPAGILIDWQALKVVNHAGRTANTLDYATECDPVYSRIESKLKEAAALIFVPKINGSTGVGYHPSTRKQGNRHVAVQRGTAGGFISDPTRVDAQEVALLVAHELGHMLRLPHPDAKDLPKHVDDAFTREMTMYATWPGKTPRWMRDVGYGRRRTGWLFTQKPTSKWAYTTQTTNKNAIALRQTKGCEVRAMRRLVKKWNHFGMQGMWRHR